LIFQYDEIVVGSSLPAVLYAFNKNLPIFFTSPRRPFRFDYLESELDLSCLKLDARVKSLTTFEGKKKIGIQKELLWERLLFLLSLDGKVPLSGLGTTMRYDGKSVVCSNEYSKIMEFNFGECHYFGDDNSIGFAGKKTLDDDIYICYDYIAFNKGGKHEIDLIHTGDDFISEIWFYSSDRIDGNTPIRDACAVSKLTAAQLLDFEYSETMARFKVVHEMEKRGMKGPFAHGYTKSGKPKHYKFRTNSINRKTHKCADEFRSKAGNILLPKVNEKSLLKGIQPAIVAYDRFLREYEQATLSGYSPNCQLKN
tara:strand:+ start:20778 stop:21710 length:933 start_codon:yes stop_codon:yes gene_type:complete